jgi:hypothetical protein
MGNRRGTEKIVPETLSKIFKVFSAGESLAEVL